MHSYVRHSRRPETPVKQNHEFGEIEQSTPRDMPPPTLDDLDFDDPPSFLGSQIEKIFWCLSARVRKLIMEKYPRKVFFCFYKGVCTWSCEDNPGIAKCRIKVHHHKQPHHFIGPHWQQLKPWIDEVERRKKIRNEIRRGRRKDDVRDVDIRPQARSIERHIRGPPMKGVTYHYPEVKPEKIETSIEGFKEKLEHRPSRKIKSEVVNWERKKIFFENQKVKIEVKNDLVINTEVIEKTRNLKFKLEPYPIIKRIYEVEEENNSLVEETIIETDNIKLDDIKPPSNDPLTVPEDKPMKSLFQVELPKLIKPKVYQEKQLTKLIRQRLKMKQKRPKIVIGPIKGRKLRLNEKKFKVKHSPFEPIEKEIQLKEILKNAETEEISLAKIDPDDVKDPKCDEIGVEIGTCKYCDECIPLKDMKDHYQTHIGITEEDANQPESDNEKRDQNAGESISTDVIPALQENSISSTENIVETEKVESNKTSVMSKKDIEGQIKQKFDAYAHIKENKDDKNACSEFIRRWGPILDIDDVSQYDQFDKEKFNIFFENLKSGKDEQGVHSINFNTLGKGCTKSTNIDKKQEDTVLYCITNEYGTTIECSESSNKLDKISEEVNADTDRAVIAVIATKEMRKTNIIAIDDIKKTTNEDRTFDEELLLNIIKNPMSLTGQNLAWTQVNWTHGDREIVYEDENIIKGAKLSLEECFQKFTDKLTNTLVEKVAEVAPAEVAVEVGGKLENQMELSKYKKKTKAAPKSVTKEKDQENFSDTSNKSKNTARSCENLGEKNCTEEHIKKEVPSFHSRSGGSEHTSRDEGIIVAIKTEYTDPNSEEYFEDIPSETELEIKSENEPKSLNLPENIIAQTMKMEPPLLITEQLTGLVDTNNDAHTKQKHFENKYNGKRKRKVNFREIETDITKSFVSVNHIKLEEIGMKENVVHDIEEKSIVPGNGLEDNVTKEHLMENKMTQKIMGQNDVEQNTFTLNQAVNVKQLNGIHVNVDHFNVVQSNLDQIHVVHKIVDHLNVVHSNVDQLNVMPNNVDLIHVVHSNVDHLNVVHRNVDHLNVVNINNEQDKEDQHMVDQHNVIQQKGDNLVLDNVGQDNVLRIKEEPGLDTEDTEDPLSVMFVIWKDDNNIDMIEDDIAHKDDLTKPAVDQEVHSTVPYLPKLKLPVSPCTPTLAYHHQHDAQIPHNAAGSPRFKKANKNPSEDIDKDNTGFKSQVERRREVRRRQCNQAQSQSTKKRRIENLHLVKRRGVFTINREGDRIGGIMGFHGRRASKRQANDPDTVYLTTQNNCDVCPSCKESLSPLVLNWRVNLVSRTVEFACHKCGQKVCMEGMWRDMAKINMNRSRNKIS